MGVQIKHRSLTLWNLGVRSSVGVENLRFMSRSLPSVGHEEFDCLEAPATGSGSSNFFRWPAN